MEEGYTGSDRGEWSAYATAQYLYHSQKWSELRDHLISSTFDLADQAKLQGLWFMALYERKMGEKKQTFLTPAQRYRVRQGNPLPPSLSATMYSANNYTPKEAKEVMNNIYNMRKYPTVEDIQHIMEVTGLNLLKVKNYFKNKRSRSRDRNCKADESLEACSINLNLDSIFGDNDMDGSADEDDAHTDTSVVEVDVETEDDL